MIKGIDTDFLVAVEIRDHRFHASADHLLTQQLKEQHEFAILPPTLAEFIHVVTDGRRMPNPLPLQEATSRAEFWWQAREVVRLYPNARATTQFFNWIRQHRLGRKRLLDTLLAASLHSNGMHHLITNNTADFKVFGCFELIPFPNS